MRPRTAFSLVATRATLRSGDEALARAALRAATWRSKGSAPALAGGNGGDDWVGVGRNEKRYGTCRPEPVWSAVSRCWRGVGAMGGTITLQSTASAQEYRGTWEQQMACTPDVWRLCGAQVPDVDRIVACLRRNTEQLSGRCRAVFAQGDTAPRRGEDRDYGQRRFDRDDRQRGYDGDYGPRPYNRDYGPRPYDDGDE